MLVTELLSADRIQVRSPHDPKLNKRAALSLVAELLDKGTGVGTQVILDALLERESLQSTGIGEGVAIPHEKLETVQALSLIHI